MTCKVSNIPIGATSISDPHLQIPLSMGQPTGDLSRADLKVIIGKLIKLLVGKLSIK